MHRRLARSIRTLAVLGALKTFDADLALSAGEIARLRTTAFGRAKELAVDNPRRLAAAVSGGLTDAGLLPPITGLPEAMMSSEFQRRFGGVGAPAYQRMSDEIDRRIAALALFR